MDVPYWIFKYISLESYVFYSTRYIFYLKILEREGLNFTWIKSAERLQVAGKNYNFKINKNLSFQSKSLLAESFVYTA